MDFQILEGSLQLVCLIAFLNNAMFRCSLACGYIFFPYFIINQSNFKIFCKCYYISKIKITLQNNCCVTVLEMTYEYCVSEIKTYQINLIDCRIGKEIKHQFSVNWGRTLRDYSVHIDFLSSGLLLSLLFLDAILKGKLAVFLTASKLLPVHAFSTITYLSLLPMKGEFQSVI